MSVKSSIITYLKTQAGLTALVGSRIRFAHAEQTDALPYIVIHNIDNVHAHHMTAAAGKVIGRFQLDCYGSTPLAATNVAEQVRQAMDGLRGSVGDVVFSMCHLDDERDSTIPPHEGVDLGIYVVQQDYLVSWSVSVPTFT